LDNLVASRKYEGGEPVACLRKVRLGCRLISLTVEFK